MRMWLRFASSSEDTRQSPQQIMSPLQVRPHFLSLRAHPPTPQCSISAERSDVPFGIRRFLNCKSNSGQYCNSRLYRPSRRKQLLLYAWLMWSAPAFHHVPRPLTEDFHALSESSPRLIRAVSLVLGFFQAIQINLRRCRLI